MPLPKKPYKVIFRSPADRPGERDERCSVLDSGSHSIKSSAAFAGIRSANSPAVSETVRETLASGPSESHRISASTLELGHRNSFHHCRNDKSFRYVGRKH